MGQKNSTETKEDDKVKEEPMDTSGGGTPKTKKKKREDDEEKVPSAHDLLKKDSPRKKESPAKKPRKVAPVPASVKSSLAFVPPQMARPNTVTEHAGDWNTRSTNNTLRKTLSSSSPKK